MNLISYLFIFVSEKYQFLNNGSKIVHHWDKVRAKKMAEESSCKNDMYLMAIDTLFENGSKVKPGDSKPVDSKFQALAAYQN